MSKTSLSTQWLSIPRPKPDARVRLFCFPYAGGSGRIFRPWANYLPDGIEVCIINLPGREARIKEPPFTHLQSLVEAIIQALPSHFDRPFALFGHSMGAVIGFELARRLRKERGLESVHLFVSGRRAPQISETDTPTYNLPLPEFIEALKQLNGTPKEVLEQDELLQLVVPLLRADFQLIQTYECSEEVPLGSPITAFGGLEDVEVSREAIAGWELQTSGRFSTIMLPGDHFFLNTSQHLLLHVIARELKQFVN